MSRDLPKNCQLDLKIKAAELGYRDESLRPHLQHNIIRILPGRPQATQKPNHFFQAVSSIDGLKGDIVESGRMSSLDTDPLPCDIIE